MRPGKTSHISREAIAFDERSDKCMTCGRIDECVCARYPGHQIQKWTGEKRNFALSGDALLKVAMREALRENAPPDFLVCVLSYFVQTGG